jgi:hypothetical protein
MELPVTRVTIIRLEHFPAYFPNEDKLNRSETIAQFLRNVIVERLPRKASLLHLPSLSQLAFFFRCSHLEIYDSLRTLRTQGFDFTLAGIDTPVELWRQKY